MTENNKYKQMTELNQMPACSKPLLGAVLLTNFKQ